MIKLVRLTWTELFCMRIRLYLKAMLKLFYRAHEAGYDIVICTGRPLRVYVPIFEEIGLPDGNYYMIINNGLYNLVD